jgi:hypothetical protein
MDYVSAYPPITDFSPVTYYFAMHESVQKMRILYMLAGIATPIDGDLHDTTLVIQ